MSLELMVIKYVNNILTHSKILTKYFTFCNECQQLDFFLLSIRSMTFIFCNQPSDFDPKVVIFLVIGDIIIKIVHSMAKE